MNPDYPTTNPYAGVPESRVTANEANELASPASERAYKVDFAADLVARMRPSKLAEPYVEGYAYDVPNTDAQHAVEQPQPEVSRTIDPDANFLAAEIPDAADDGVPYQEQEESSQRQGSSWWRNLPFGIQNPANGSQDNLDQPDSLANRRALAVTDNEVGFAGAMPSESDIYTEALAQPSPQPNQFFDPSIRTPEQLDMADRARAEAMAEYERVAPTHRYPLQMQPNQPEQPQQWRNAA